VEAQHTNVVLKSVLQRFDLNKTINEEIRKYSRKLHKLIKRFKNIQLIESVCDTELFTQHGVHLNRKGKEVMKNILFVSCIIIKQVQVLPTNALLLLKIFLHYKTLFQHVSIPIGLIFRDWFKN
jgi:predicted NACHT family NTPase